MKIEELHEVVGKDNKYHCPNINLIDEYLIALNEKCKRAKAKKLPELVENFEYDMDLLLERRMSLEIVERLMHND